MEVIIAKFDTFLVQRCLPIVHDNKLAPHRRKRVRRFANKTSDAMHNMFKCFEQLRFDPSWIKALFIRLKSEFWYHNMMHHVKMLDLEWFVCTDDPTAPFITYLAEVMKKGADEAFG